MSNRGKPEGERKTKSLDDFDLMERDARQKIDSQGRASVGKSLKLEYPQDKDPDYFYFWAVNTEKTVTDIQSLLDRGFEFDRFKTGKNKGEKITKRVRGVDHYGMRHPAKLRKEDLKIAQDALNKQNAQVNTIGDREYGALEPGKETAETIKRELVENPDILDLTI